MSVIPARLHHFDEHKGINTSEILLLSAAAVFKSLRNIKQPPPHYYANAESFFKTESPCLTLAENQKSFRSTLVSLLNN
jgi:hypothetical protein